MWSVLFLVLSDFKVITLPAPPAGPWEFWRDPSSVASGRGLLVLMIGAGLILLWRGLRTREGRVRTLARTAARNWILVDGSNVMHWQENAPQLAPLLGVVARLRALGYAPGVVFDANAGWKLFGRYLDDRDLARLMQLPPEQVFVVPKGMQADPFLLEAARDHKARIVTNDRYRDWAETYPEVMTPGFLVRGYWREAAVVLRGLDKAPVEAGVNRPATRSG
jgi:Zc3h12a-like Ribonuclease NYN domain